MVYGIRNLVNRNWLVGHKNLSRFIRLGPVEHDLGRKDRGALELLDLPLLAIVVEGGDLQARAQGAGMPNGITDSLVFVEVVRQREDNLSWNVADLSLAAEKLELLNLVRTQSRMGELDIEQSWIDELVRNCMHELVDVEGQISLPHLIR